MLQKAPNYRQNCHQRLYCKVCCSMNSSTRNPSRLIKRFNSILGKRTSSRLPPSSSCVSRCRAELEELRPQPAEDDRCGRRSVPTNRSLPNSSAMAWRADPAPIHHERTPRHAALAIGVALNLRLDALHQVNLVAGPRASATRWRRSHRAPPAPARSADRALARAHR